MMMTSHGLSPHFSRNRNSMAFTAPRPSKTAPKQSAARMIHMNMQLMPRVLRMVSSITRRLSPPFARAAIAAAVNTEKQARHQEAGETPGQPQLADRLAGDHAVENENDAGRDQDAQGAS